MSILDLLIGPRVSNRDAEGRKLGVLQAIPAMGMDSLSSAAYGPEAALAVLAAAGSAGLAAITPITIAIVVLLVMLAFSYWQTVAAYPSSGGSYIVARENLQSGAGLLAAAALMVDYTLNAAVGISAGVAALTSAVPSLQHWNLLLCLAVLAAITVMNLRGTREAGTVWAFGVHLFVATLGCTVVWGIANWGIASWGIASHAAGHPTVVASPAASTNALSAWLVLRAFASGCTAMTGIEAVSNSMNAFRDPPTPRARATLAILTVVLSCLLLGIARLAASYGVMAMDQTRPGYRTVVAQLAGAVFGQGWFYYLTLFSTLWVLCLSANTSFVGFPRLCHMLARDGYLPRAFAVPGRRLVYSVGILVLAVGAGGLLIAFGGITDRLIPLFAIGAFLAFTLSQAGMAVHWWRAAGNQGSRVMTRTKLLVNGSGAVATGVALGIILLTKFMAGAWITVIVIPLILLLLYQINRYYRQLDQRLCRDADKAVDLRDRGKPAVLVPIGGWNQVTRNAIEFALRLSDDVTALHVTTLQGEDLDEQAKSLRKDWLMLVEQPARKAGLTRPKLRMPASQFRSIVTPLLHEIEAARRRVPDQPIFILLPGLAEDHWWEVLLHTHHERHLRSQLFRACGPDVEIITVPWRLSSPEGTER